jgi:hypothetical protein
MALAHFGEGELKRTEKRRPSPLGAGAVIRRPPKVPEIANRIAAPVEIEQYYQMCARTQIILEATGPVLRSFTKLPGHGRRQLFMATLLHYSSVMVSEQLSSMREYSSPVFTKHETAFPRLQSSVSRRELIDLCTPTPGRGPLSRLCSPPRSMGRIEQLEILVARLQRPHYG